MSKTLKALGAALTLTVLGTGAAWAGEAAKDCCEQKADCCDKAADCCDHMNKDSAPAAHAGR